MIQACSSPEVALLRMRSTWIHVLLDFKTTFGLKFSYNILTLFNSLNWWVLINFFTVSCMMNSKIHATERNYRSFGTDYE